MLYPLGSYTCYYEEVPVQIVSSECILRTVSRCVGQRHRWYVHSWQHGVSTVANSDGTSGSGCSAVTCVANKLDVNGNVAVGGGEAGR